MFQNKIPDASSASITLETPDGRLSSQWAHLKVGGGIEALKTVVCPLLFTGRFESWVITTRADGATQVQVLDAFGKVKAIDTSNILNSGINLSGVKL